MYHTRHIFRCAAALVTIALMLTGVSTVQAQHWMLLEARDLPQQCTRPISCIGRSTLAARNLLNVAPAERNALLQTLNRISTIRGLPDDLGADTVIVPESMVPALHPLPKADKLALLVNHPGVYFDPAALDAGEATSNFSSYVISQLSAAGVRFLTKDELENTPGRPTLSIRYTARSESAGCIIPFSVSFSISEETVMVRNPALKVSGTAWSGLVRENLANTNYTPENALQDVVEKFVIAWKEANP